MEQDDNKKVFEAVCRLWKKFNGQACCIGRITTETKLHEGQCRSIIEELVSKGVITRVRTVDMNNHRRYCYKPIECGCEEITEILSKI
ncbi:MAG: hypothetical protein VR72_19305 [Clostridiaceae bacterium BRH_c20a]|nr:MAG: hypothetical protein VR72_19305 [Clostridiaceae bacterium BRH_c20a]